jgi:hypothetical protein
MCGPLLTETSLCGAYLQLRQSRHIRALFLSKKGNVSFCCKVAMLAEFSQIAFSRVSLGISFYHTIKKKISRSLLGDVFFIALLPNLRSSVVEKIGLC